MSYNFDPAKPASGDLLDDAAVRQNFAAMPGSVFAYNGVRDPLLNIWSAGDALAPDHWILSGAGATIGRNNASAAIGPNCAGVTSGGAAAAQLYQHFLAAASFRNYFRGKQFSFGCYIKGSAIAVARPFIYDGIAYTYGNYNVGTATNEWISVSATLDAAATMIRYGVEVIASGSPTAYVDGGVFVPGAIKPDLFFPGRPTRGQFGLTIQGTLVVGTSQLGLSWQPPYPCIVQEVRLKSITAPTGASVLVDVNKNGTSMFTAGGRPAIAIGGTTGSGLPDTTYATKCFGRTDVLTVDIDQIGSTVAGADLTVEVVVVCFPHPMESMIGTEVN